MRAPRLVALASACAAIGIGSLASGQQPAPAQPGKLPQPPAEPPAATAAPANPAASTLPPSPPPQAAPGTATPPYGAQPYGAPPPGSPYGAQPYGAPPPGSPYGAQPYGAQPYGAQPYGAPAYPGAYQYPPGWSRDAKKKPPKKIAYQEGAPVPAGYHVEDQVRLGPVIAGSIVGGLGYVIVAYPAMVSWDEVGNSTRALVVPVLGPWITLATYERCDEYSDHEICLDTLINMLLVIDGAMQVTGAALLTYGLASKKQYLIRDDVALAPRITRIAPMSLGAHGMGLTVGGEL